ncbi:MAG: hypothetical protein JRJ19_08225 [Deltaproteobacteria bacterium]|nr:hypothetical protein [Deltaproteobacteria bacterium]
MKCEHCGAEQASGRVCETCGRMLTRIMVPEGPGAGERRQKFRPDVLKCTACGSEQASGHFCDKCGLELDFYRVEDDELVIGGRCRQCGKWSKDRICPNCGIMIANYVSGEE